MSRMILDAVRYHLTEEFGQEPDSASVTFLGLEPIDVLRFAIGDVLTYVTLGCSRHPMTDPAASVVDSESGPRAELVLSVLGSDDLPGVHRTMAVLAATPSVEGIILAPDGLLDLADPLWEGAEYTGVLLGASEIPELIAPGTEDPVQFLRASPVTATEMAWVRAKGPAALREAWAEAGIQR